MAQTYPPYILHWFRRDLRFFDNPCLLWAHKKLPHLLGIFCFDRTFLMGEDFSFHRFQFFLLTLESLQKELEHQGTDLLVFDNPPHNAFPFLFSELKKKKIPLPQFITWNRDYEPFSRVRDKKMEGIFKEEGITTKTCSDHLLIEPWELMSENNNEKKPYKVFSHFKKAWLKKITETKLFSPLMEYQTFCEKIRFLLPFPISTLGFDTSILKKTLTTNKLKTSLSLPPCGFHEAIKRVDTFSVQLHNYTHNRDIPSLDGTSKMSIYSKNGSITTKIILQTLKIQPQHVINPNSSQHTFLSEIIWREFYYAILYHFPYVEKKAFQKKYETIEWSNNTEWFEAWKQGETGFPIVDAAQRQLNQTGWMHNRLRMITASFLTKDLHIDWRWGENYFMQQLLDGDLAPNNGGWQWSASTGCDSQPYFRIMNPHLQAKTYDPTGTFIYTYIPELRGIPPSQLFDEESLSNLSLKKYPKPLICHKVEREKTLRLFKNMTTTADTTT